jgi:UDP-N-acetylmuramate dehydrogenase
VAAANVRSQLQSTGVDSGWAMSFESDLRHQFGDRVGANVALAPLTTFRVGGPADWLVEVGSSADLRQALRLAHLHGVAVTVIGGGSNVLVADRGVRGLTVRVHGGEIVHEAIDAVRADAGVGINGLVRWTITRGLAGLEAWAGTPGSVGGAVFGNAHFQGRLLGDTIRSIRLATREGDVVDVDGAAMEFGYDRSRLQRTGEVLLSALFSVAAGKPALLREAARASLAFRKRTQPLHLPSAGCVFQNPDPEVDQLPPGVPASAGALIDRAGLKGARVGGARVSTVHANFIVNEGHATASDVRTLAERCRRGVEEAFGVTLREEIVYLGDFGT